MHLFETFSQPAWHALGWTLVHFLWQGAAVGLLAAAVVGIARPRRGNPRYALYLAAFALMAACPLATFFVLGGRTPLSEPTVAMTGDVHHEPRPSGSGLPAPGYEDSDTGAEISPPAVAIPTAPLRSRLGSVVEPVLPHFLLAWIGGAALMSLRLTLGFAALHRLRRTARPLPLELADRFRTLAHRCGLPRFARAYASPAVREPIAMGLLRPIILVPLSIVTELPPAALEAILAHELAHIRRHDLWVNLFQRVVESLLFFHPAVWWLSRRIRQEREVCCDATAIAITGQRLDYAETLERLAARVAGAESSMPQTQELGHAEPLSQAPQVGAILATAFGLRRGDLLDRIRHVLGIVPNESHNAWWPAGVVAMLAVSFIVIACANRGDRVSELKSLMARITFSDKIVLDTGSEGHMPSLLLTGNVQIVLPRPGERDTLLRADKVVISLAQVSPGHVASRSLAVADIRGIELEGNVTITDHETTLRATRVFYDMSSSQSHAVEDGESVTLSRQSIQEEPTSTGPLPEDLQPPNPAEYRVGLGDWLYVSIAASQASATFSTEVDAAGTIDLDRLGSIRAIGQTTDELEAWIIDWIDQDNRSREAAGGALNYYGKDPVVHVSLESSGSAYVLLSESSATKPGAYTIPPTGLTLRQLIASTGDVYGNVRQATVLRRTESVDKVTGKPRRAQRTILIDMPRLLAGDASQNIYLRPKDQVLFDGPAAKGRGAPAPVPPGGPGAGASAPFSPNGKPATDVSAEETASSERLQDLAVGTLTYAINNRRAYPPDLGTLAKQGYIYAATVLNPRLPNRPAPPAGATGDELAAWVNKHSDYVLRPMGRLGDRLRGSNILLYEKVSEELKGPIHVAHDDGSVQRYEDRLEALRQLWLAGEIDWHNIWFASKPEARARGLSYLLELAGKRAPGDSILDDDWASRSVMQLATFCGPLKDREAAPVLRRFVAKDVRLLPGARAAAIWALGMIHEGKPDADLSKLLVQRLFDQNPLDPEAHEVRLQSAVALGRIKARDQLDNLRHKYNNDSLEIRAAARWAITNITGEELPPIDWGDKKPDNELWFLDPPVR